MIIANPPPTAIEALRSFAYLEDVHIVIGDHFSETNIRRAAPERARKVLILADRTPSTAAASDADGNRRPHDHGGDDHFKRGARHADDGEIVDPEMDHYLKLANVTEIIYSSEYARLLLGNATSGTGIANIVLDLLDNKSSAHITSTAFPESCLGKTYAEGKAALRNRRTRSFWWSACSKTAATRTP